MTRETVGLEQLEATQAALMDAIRAQIEQRDVAFLLSLKRGQPDWSLLDLAGISELPAVNWKLTNIRAMAEGKRAESLARLEQVLLRLMVKSGQ